jgi:hypothetical protein
MSRSTRDWSLLIAVLITGCGADHPAIWNGGVRALTMSHGSGGPPLPFLPTDECTQELVTYTLSVAPALLDGSICSARSVMVALPLVRRAATVALSAAQLDELRPTLELLRVTDDAECFEDVSARTG